MCVSRASLATASLIMVTIIDIRSYPKGRRLVIFIILFILHNLLLLFFMSRAAWTAKSAISCVIMNINNKNVYCYSRRETSTLSPPIQRELDVLCMIVSMCQHRPPKTPKTQYFGPTDIACLPGPKIDRNFRNFVIYKKINIYFNFYKILL
jgi:hypothetical protein